MTIARALQFWSLQRKEGILQNSASRWRLTRQRIPLSADPVFACHSFHANQAPISRQRSSLWLPAGIVWHALAQWIAVRWESVLNCKPETLSSPLHAMHILALFISACSYGSWVAICVPCICCSFKWYLKLHFLAFLWLCRPAALHKEQPATSLCMQSSWQSCIECIWMALDVYCSNKYRKLTLNTQTCQWQCHDKAYE